MTMLTVNGIQYETQNCGRSRSLQQEPGDVLRFEVRPGDQWPGDAGRACERSEIAGSSLPCPNVCTVEFDLMVEPGIAKNSAEWLLLSQFHQSAKAPDGAPPFALEMAGEEFRVVARKNPQDYQRLFADAAFQRGRWYWLQIRLDFAKGQIDVFRDRVQIVQYRAPFGYGDPVGGYWKAGIYRASAPETMVARYRGLTVIGS